MQFHAISNPGHRCPMQHPQDSYVDSKALRMQEVRIMLVGRWLRARGPCGSALQHKTCAQVTSPCEAIISRITPTPA